MSATLYRWAPACDRAELRERVLEFLRGTSSDERGFTAWDLHLAGVLGKDQDWILGLLVARGEIREIDRIPSPDPTRKRAKVGVYVLTGAA